MKIGERGQVAIPKPFRERFELSPSTEVEFVAEQGELILRKKNFHSEKAARSAKMKNWIGCLDGQPEDVDRFIDDIRGPFVGICNARPEKPDNVGEITERQEENATASFRIS